MKYTLIILFLFALLGCNNTIKEESMVTTNNLDWTMLGFIKADSINPILTPSLKNDLVCLLSIILIFVF